MLVLPRILRADSENLDRGPPKFTARQRERHERVVAHATLHMARYGRHSLTFRNLATGLTMSPATLRLHFADLDALLAEILHRHLRALSQAIGEIPYDSPDRDSRRRAAYMAITRTGLGGFTPAHHLLVQERHTLPDDVRDIIEQTRSVIGESLAGARGPEALAYLDTPFLDAARIEANLAPPAETKPPLLSHPKRPEKPLRPTPHSPAAAPDSPAAEEKPGDWIYALAGATARGPPG